MNTPSQSHTLYYYLKSKGKKKKTREMLVDEMYTYNSAKKGWKMRGKIVRNDL